MVREYIIKVSGEIMDKDEDILEGFPEIVRCRDCKYWEDSENCPVYDLERPEDWFCADGERKEGR